MLDQYLSNIIKEIETLLMARTKLFVTSADVLNSCSGKPWVMLIAVSHRFRFIVNSSLARKKIPEYYSCSLPKCRQRRSLAWVDVFCIL